MLLSIFLRLYEWSHVLPNSLPSRIETSGTVICMQQCHVYQKIFLMNSLFWKSEKETKSEVASIEHITQHTHTQSSSFTLLLIHTVIIQLACCPVIGAAMLCVPFILYILAKASIQFSCKRECNSKYFRRERERKRGSRKKKINQQKNHNKTKSILFRIGCHACKYPLPLMFLMKTD